MTLIIRICLTGILLYFVYQETGFATTLLFALNVVAFELANAQVSYLYRVIEKGRRV